MSWSSTALTFSVRRRPGNTRGSSGVTISSSTCPLPGVTNTPTPFGSWRSKPSDGELRTVTAFSPSARATIVVEPPPSRFSAVSAPRATNVRASWRSVTPSTGAWRPSTVTSSIVLPPSLKPIAVRGWTALSSWLSGSAAPLRTSGWLPPTANCMVRAISSFRPYVSVASSPGASARMASAAASRPTSTKPLAGISPAPVPVGLTETTLLSCTRTSATFVTPSRPRLRAYVPQALVNASIEPAATPSPLAALSVRTLCDVPFSDALASSVRSTSRPMPSLPTPA